MFWDCESIGTIFVYLREVLVMVFFVLFFCWDFVWLVWFLLERMGFFVKSA